MTRYVRTLEEVGAADLALVGGKGANLGELVRAGVPVPQAFCVTTDAYRAFLDDNGLWAPIAEVLAQVDYDDPSGIAASAEQIRALLLAAPAPEGVVRDVTAAYEHLEARLGDAPPVSVRSSATAEDLPDTSFAGQQDTYLHITGCEAVLDAVRRCWASLWTDRAIAYRHRQGFDHGSVLLAVVVQEMFPSEVAGVLFTANPVTSNPFQYFLNASWGLGEAVVSGHVNPDQLIVAKESFEIVDRQVSEKLVMTVPDPSGQGSTTVDVPAEKRSIPCLDDGQVVELCRLAQRIEDHYGFYQDVEWGWADGRFAILQAREVTGADLDFGHELEVWKHPRALADMYDPRWVWSRAYSDEFQTGPSTPSFYTYLQAGMTSIKTTAFELAGVDDFLDYGPDELLQFPHFRWYGARAYYNLALERERIRRFIPPFARDDAALWPFPAAEREELRNLPFDWDAFLGLLRRLHEERPDVSLLGSTRVIYDNLERWVADEDRFWAAYDWDAASIEDILTEQVTPHTDSVFRINVALPFTVYLYILPPALEHLCRAWLDDDGSLATLLLSGLQTKTVEENVALWRLSRPLASSPALRELFATTPNEAMLDALEETEEGRAFRARFDEFLAAYGHRGGAERDSYHKRWREAPENVFQSLRVLVELGDEHDPEAQERRQRERMLEAKAAAAARLREHPVDEGDFWWVRELHSLTGEPSPDQGTLFEWFVELVQDWMYYRDYERFHNDKNMGRYRKGYEVIGRRLADQGVLLHADDIFFLGRPEMRAVATGELSPEQARLRVRVRRRVYERYSHQEPPKFIRGWEAFDDDAVDADGALVGIGASVGTVTGTARVCRTLAEISKLRPGDILVTVATDPGWTTAFSILGGVVVETGGVVAHAVMISREYGLPCVANLARACDLIPDGATITIDGGTGRVVIEDVG